MSVIDTLQILITADSSGIEKVLKQSINIVKGSVDQMNEEEVDWTSIFTRAVSPAIISGVASMFAFAIAQSVNFQQSLNTAGTAAGESTTQIAQTGQAALTMSSQVGSSATDIASAMLQVGKIFGNNSSATNEVVQAMSQLSDAGFGPLNDIVSSSLQLFKDFGVTTGTDAVSVLTDLMHGAQASGESISSLATQFDAYAPALVAAGANLSSFNGLISAFAGNIQALGLTNTEAQFQALGNSVNNPAGAFEILGENVKSVAAAIQTGNINPLLDSVSKKVAELGSSSQLVGTAFGFSSTAINAFIQKSQDLSTVDTDVKGVYTNIQTIQSAWTQADNAMLEFKKDFNAISADFTSSGLANYFTQVAIGLGDVIKLVDKLVGADIGKAIGDIVGNSPLFQVFGAIGQGIGALYEKTFPSEFTPPPSNTNSNNQNNSSVVNKNTINVTLPPGTNSNAFAKQLYNSYNSQ